MPLPGDEKLLALSHDLLAQFDQIFGLHPGFRPAHAKGILLTGRFQPSPEAATLSGAPHLKGKFTPVTVRFSNSTGVPLIPDTDPNADPRGMSIRFHLGEHVHTDIIGHSTCGFPVRTGPEFLEFLRALAATAPGAASPTPIEQYLGRHPAALAFVQMPRPTPVSFATEKFYGVNALHFINAAGETRFGRYRIDPERYAFLRSDETSRRDPNFLFDELKQHIAAKPITFEIRVQLAQPGDVVDDATVDWPESREQTLLGTLTLDALVPDDVAAQKQIIFDPIPRVDGIEPSDDPLLELRAALYLISGRRRRAA